MSDASVDPQALPDEGLQIDEGAAVFSATMRLKTSWVLPSLTLMRWHPPISQARKMIGEPFSGFEPALTVAKQGAVPEADPYAQSPHPLGSPGSLTMVHPLKPRRTLRLQNRAKRFG